MIPNNEQPKQMVENISCILPQNYQLGGLFLGNVFGAQNSQILKEYGIRAVITTSAETKISYKLQDVPFHLKIEAHDKDDYYISQHINECIYFIEQNRKFTNVFVHCYAGVSRSSAIVCAYLMWKYRWNLQKVLNFLVFKRVVAKPNPGFYNQLKEVQVKLKIGPDTKIINNRNQQVIAQPTSPSFYKVSQNNYQKLQVINGHQSIETSQATGLSNSNGFQPQIRPQAPSLSQIPQIQQMQKIQQIQQIPSDYSESSTQAYRGSIKEESKKTEPISNSSRILQGRQSVYEKPSVPNGQSLNHSGVPIPKILSRRSEKLSKGELRDEIDKKYSFNDYLSPQILPTSPRNNNLPKAVLKMGATGLNYGNSSKNCSSNIESYVQSSIYSTNYKAKGGYQNQQKVKSSSRCLIRPKDLPGYKNY